MERGIFTLSLDFELIWGTLDIFGPKGFRNICEVEKKEVIDRLLKLFVDFNVSATWCVLGHLFLGCCRERNGKKHQEIKRPNYSWHKKDWFTYDPCSSEEKAPIFYGRGLVNKICACEVPQEIGCHSFSHIIFGDPGCGRETADSEIAACVRLAEKEKITLRSFAFPRNDVGHLDVLKKYGFTCYRGPEPRWYNSCKLPHFLKRAGHLLDILTANEPPVVIPQITASGLWNIPASMMYFPMHGVRRFIPISFRVNRAIKGLEAAARQKKIFHLWFHPTNLADQMDKMFKGLSTILECVSDLRKKGKMDVRPMGALVPMS